MSNLEKSKALAVLETILSLPREIQHAFNVAPLLKKILGKRKLKQILPPMNKYSEIKEDPQWEKAGRNAIMIPGFIAVWEKTTVHILFSDGKEHVCSYPHKKEELLKPCRGFPIPKSHD